MSSPEISGGVSAYLDALYEQYEGFDVQQTTVSVDPEEFDSVDTRGDIAEVRVRVEGTDGVLAVSGDDEWVTPGGVVEAGTSLSAAASELVERQTGVDCHIEGLDRVSLVCLQCDGSDREVWQLSALFEASVDDAETTAPAEGAAWRQSLSESTVAF
jgi:ADP-ribose pyrophosphatase YjhB (NUDIX family)